MEPTHKVHTEQAILHMELIHLPHRMEVHLFILLQLILKMEELVQLMHINSIHLQLVITPTTTFLVRVLMELILSLTTELFKANKTLVLLLNQ